MKQTPKGLRLQDTLLRRTMEYSNQQLDALSREIAAEFIERERVSTGRLPNLALTYSGYVIRVTPTDGTFLNVRAMDNRGICHGWTRKL